MADQSQSTAWQFYRGGKIVPITEDEARHTFDGWRVLSDDRGAATLMVDQMWAEIDGLRALMREMYRPACIYEGAGCEDLGRKYPEVLARALGEANDAAG